MDTTPAARAGAADLGSRSSKGVRTEEAVIDRIQTADRAVVFGESLRS